MGSCSVTARRGRASRCTPPRGSRGGTASANRPAKSLASSSSPWQLLVLYLAGCCEVEALVVMSLRLGGSFPAWNPTLRRPCSACGWREEVVEGPLLRISRDWLSRPGDPPKCAYTLIVVRWGPAGIADVVGLLRRRGRRRPWVSPEDLPWISMLHRYPMTAMDILVINLWWVSLPSPRAGLPVAIPIRTSALPPPSL